MHQTMLTTSIRSSYFVITLELDYVHSSSPSTDMIGAHCRTRFGRLSS